MKMQRTFSKIFGVSIITILVVSSFTSIVIGTFNETIILDNKSPLVGGDSFPYEGRLILYVTEPESRWNMYNGQPYHFGSMGTAFDGNLDIDYLDTFEDTITWEGTIDADNVLVMAAVFNPGSEQKYAYPPSQNPFDAHFVDAACAAIPDETAYNTVNETFTHTVFLEEGTATWCQYCPAMAGAIYNVYSSDDYPFYFVSLIDDKSPGASSRLRNDYNLYGFPTVFFDGGYNVIVGGDSNENHYRTKIESCGRRNVHDLNLTLSVEYIGGGDLEIYVSITNYEEMYPPETPVVPSGRESGTVGLEYTYATNTTDPDEGDKLSYYFDWGDGTNSGWIGSYTSGAVASASHTWTVEGDFDVKVKARDKAEHETDWSDALPVHITPPEFLFDVNSELMLVTADITNDGDDELPMVDWSIDVKGGLLKLIDVYVNGSIEHFGVGEIVSIKTGSSIVGLGLIDITITVDTTVYMAKGVVIGPFVFIL